jgi:hypothetical protein
MCNACDDYYSQQDNWITKYTTTYAAHDYCVLTKKTKYNRCFFFIWSL